MPEAAGGILARVERGRKEAGEKRRYMYRGVKF